MPQWRKELGERVREVQERRLRETAQENGGSETASGEDGAKTPLLELLPQAEVSPLNPLVVAALARIERAHVPAHSAGSYTNFGGATAVAYAEQPDFTSEVSAIAGEVGPNSLPGSAAEPQKSVAPERVHNLAVVPNPLPLPADAPILEVAPFEEESSRATPKPKRLIGGDPNDPALNYLDTIPTSTTVDDCSKNVAPIHLRIFSSVIDLVVVGVLSWVPLALSGLTDLAWHDRSALVLAVITFIVVAFLYSTICTALTGQSLGMKLFSLRVIDARTRMLPTGSQSAGRALVYILSVASTGIPLMYTFIDRDKRTAHDRFTRTEVVRI
ncbi:MAG: RDD family protein [Pyrinomonadaceae bacterium]|nr:RDD family protein [Pyrinomonadaceae bacterium]